MMATATLPGLRPCAAFPEPATQRGFLPSQDPLRRLPPAFDDWEEVASQLPKLLVSDHLRPTLEQLPPFLLEALSDRRERERALTLLSCLGHAYVWRGEEPAAHVPERLAVPWYAVAAGLGLPPILTYSSYILNNYLRFHPHRATELGNLAVIQNLNGGLDEEWFVLTHVEIEHRAAPAIAVLHRCLDAADAGDAPLLEHHLATVLASLEAMCGGLLKMTEGCDPYVYYQRVRPYLNGWKGHPALAGGVIYEGVSAYGGRPQEFRGPTGAQSAVIPALDAALGIDHQENALCSYLREMRDYMPPAHRQFVASIEARVPVRPFVERCGLHTLAERYDACVAGLERFRSLHLQFAATYVFRQAQTDARNPHALGTGGTSFMTHLKQRLNQTAVQRVQSHSSNTFCPHAR